MSTDASPDALDPNWPKEKAFRAVDIPAGLAVGQRFVVGDSDGQRFLLRVVKCDGRVGVE